MPGSQSLSKPQIFTYDLADANLTGFASNVTGASWTLARNSATDGLAHQVSVRNDSGNSKAGINITFVGTDPDGNALTETIAGPAGSATVETTGYFYTLTSVTPASTWGADTGDIGWVDEVSSQTIATNHLAEDTVIINVDVTGTANFSVQQTFDNVLDASLYSAPAQQVQWINIAASQAADNQWYADGGAAAVRILVNSYSSGAELSVNVNATYVSSNSSGGGGGGGDVNLIEVGGAAIALGQTTMSASLPVAIASNQTWTGATNLGKAEDAAHASGDTGVMALGVRVDTATAFGANGDYTPFRTDQYGDQFTIVADTTGTPLTYLPPGIAAASASSPVVAARATSLNNNQVAVTATVGTLLTQNTSRMSVTFLNVGANTAWIGEATTTTANGFALIPGASYTSQSSALFQAICDTGLTTTIAYMEEVA